MPYYGSEVVSKHKDVVSKCRDKYKSGWDLLACIVNDMQVEYKGVKLPGGEPTAR